MLTRWRGMLGMVVGVGIALAIGMTLLGAARASIDNFTIDFRSSAANLYVVAEGGNARPGPPQRQPGHDQERPPRAGRHPPGGPRWRPPWG